MLNPLLSSRVTNRSLSSKVNCSAIQSRTIATLRLQGKKCMVTGGSRGIGAAIAARFAHEGALCTLIGRDEAALEKSSSQLSNIQSDQIHNVRVGNVSDRKFWETLAREQKDVDVLVNAAGISHSSLLTFTNQELVDKIIQTNLMGSIWACQLMTKAMIRRRNGCIINVSSLLGVKGGKGSTIYAASKAGVLGLTRSLAAEVGSCGIRVNAIVPGYIETSMTDAMDPNAKSQALASIPQKRFGTVDEIADAALFLATNEYANNCTLSLDGGLSAT